MSQSPEWRAKVERTYAEHPLNAADILERVRAERGSLNGIRARDLAEAAAGGATDQNHIGGANAIRELAALVGVRAGWRVLDIGSGLGGTLRLLADEFGCHGHGVELTRTRYEDAMNLTSMVGLDRAVTFSHGDFLETSLPDAAFDLAVAQGVLMHFADIEAVLRRARRCLRATGQLVVEDIVLLPHPLIDGERSRLETLQDSWNGKFTQIDRWFEHFADAGFRVTRADDLTPMALGDFANMLVSADSGRLRHVTASERQGWEVGLHLLASGYLSAQRVICHTTANSHTFTEEQR